MTTFPVSSFRMLICLSLILLTNDALSCQLFPHAELPASDIFLHERYDPGSLRNDIALIR